MLDGVLDGGKSKRFCEVGDGDGLRRDCRASWCLVSGAFKLFVLERVAGGSGGSPLICSWGELSSSCSVLLDRNRGRNLSMKW